jgi:hypothetical protein
VAAKSLGPAAQIRQNPAHLITQLLRQRLPTSACTLYAMHRDYGYSAAAATNYIHCVSLRIFWLLRKLIEIVHTSHI